MLFSTKSIPSLAVGFLAIWSCTAQLAETDAPTPTQPAHCSTTIDDFEHMTGWVTTHSCYTYTSTTQASSCPTYSRDPSAICPLYIQVSTIDVPCATDCCPTTGTTYVTEASCSTSVPCPVSTEYITSTTGCAPSAKP
ncbi:uncharacterized protein BCR38DRAFT_189108 [Pseudomassariella vexata]|uniref:Uncharacterized protein n=1 Tax=Pseudomassariella vexata TaxID=1141098 RepID=A0A1Y2E2B6_9PEZI|nr:uncharacterized protein BCR38DRAFT_189108 [Pseudomassariella vexata]ORY65005.1 hypothetical protein BCR38DRAFT_189108 [Pseudomassariella vexata]